VLGKRAEALPVVRLDAPQAHLLAHPNVAHIAPATSADVQAQAAMHSKCITVEACVREVLSRCCFDVVTHLLHRTRGMQGHRGGHQLAGRPVPQPCQMERGATGNPGA
jgi:hypothetical protein